METADVLGIQCYRGQIETGAELVREYAQSGRGGYACFCNVHVAVTAQRHSQLREALRDATVVFPDGAPIAWLARRGGTAAARIPGPDLMARVLQDGTADGLRHAFYGSTPQTLSSVVARAAERGADVVAAISPPFRRTELTIASELAELVSAQPDVVWVGLGAPKQELWMRQHAQQLAPSFVVGVGAAFDFLGGTKRRAPAWMQRVGLEWMHRLLSEPRRLGLRYLTTNTEFLARALYDLSRRR